MEPTIHSDAARTLQKVLVDARRAAGLTQVAVAIRLAKPQSFVSDVERGERRLDVVEFARFCRAIDVDPVRLYAEFVSAAAL
jgi:transcriptional regulator with XRE-family HTH domain